MALVPPPSFPRSFTVRRFRNSLRSAAIVFCLLVCVLLALFLDLTQRNKLNTNAPLQRGIDEWCDDIYIDWDGESEEDGYICAPCNSPDTTCATRGGELVCGALSCAELSFPQ